ncbi:hypothetical protein TVAG_328610 [Trichomonas vaginalis G3]|uniref:Uncharacterized protein n=1 Tax=Trichomonas vaginalis (strain ATCC PRA-98 / G3) TaxID=412133 RepID=A2F4T6_TRIV3|nr:hypothetical protein TVAGG3_0149170 [Trichomonas vaginalis G3]EAY00099.1 hypothetical protein TVAG_328610 [Trichomonas vaginalis G3]KAI5547155.1 hypothetical protein TVAGG3_0149170 [Trichomonas vaginalis G3]|eukprot:XP_001313028.1 hypothetical protein [Trichomonas vaginalis G3]
MSVIFLMTMTAFSASNLSPTLCSYIIGVLLVNALQQSKEVALTTKLAAIVLLFNESSVVQNVKALTMANFHIQLLTQIT